MPKASQLYVAAYDVHYPQYDKRTFAALIDFLGENRVDGFIFGGDQLDNACISHHNRGKGLYKLPGQYAAETKGFDRHILTQIESKIGDAERVWIKGNHDNWEYELTESSPEMQGSVERDILLNLRDRGWNVIEMGRPFVKGELTFVHGEALSGCGNQNSAMHARKAIEVYCRNVVYGHYHAPQSYTKILPTDDTRKWMAYCSPVIADCNPTYLENRPTAWLNGFTIVEFREKGLFNVYPVIVIDGKFSFGGKVYGK